MARGSKPGPVDRQGLQQAIAALLRATGLDPEGDTDLMETPARVAKMWEVEFLSGYAMDPVAILSAPVLGEADPDVVVVGGLRFHSMCPHHLVPYRGVAHVAYIPRGKLVGFGRLADLVECFTKRLTLQERATHQIADALCTGLGAAGAGCVIEAEQLCLALPGERHDQSGVVTSAFVGEMRERPDLKARLLEAANLGGPYEVNAAGAPLRLDGTVAVVTGASRGIGRAIATQLARAGARVAGCHVSQGKDRGFLTDLDPAEADRCRLEICDVSDADAVSRFARKVLDEMGTPFILVNNAGQVVRSRIEDTSPEDWQRVLDVNLTGTFLVTRAFLPAMRVQGRGRIIQIASISGKEGTPHLSAYCSAKHGVIGFTRSLARELDGTQITANAVCPGSVDTDMLSKDLKPDMSPADVADVVFFLATGAPVALDGACIDVFG